MLVPTLIILWSWYDEKDYENKVNMLAPLASKIYPKLQSFYLRPVETAVTVESVQWNWMEWRELLWPQNDLIPTHIYQSPLEQIWETNPWSNESIGFNKTLWTSDASRRRFRMCASCFQVSKQSKGAHIFTYMVLLCLIIQRFVMGASHAQQIVSLAQTSPEFFFPLTVIEIHRQGRTLRTPWEADTSSSCVFKQLWSFSATPSRGSWGQRT